MTFRLILVGPPGAGKGTQAKIVSEKLGIPAISTGEIFREEIEKGSEVGEIAARYIHGGNLVPDDVTHEVVRRRLAEPDAANGFLLDGYPRTAEQVTELDVILDELGTHIDAIVELAIPDEEILKRLVDRAGKEGRLDDNEEVIQHRIRIYRSTTEPIVNAYEARGQSIEVDGMGTIDEVRERIVEAVKAQVHEN